MWRVGRNLAKINVESFGVTTARGDETWDRIVMERGGSLLPWSHSEPNHRIVERPNQLRGIQGR